jgi:beta-lactam-binding protein with PASTA domain
VPEYEALSRAGLGKALAVTVGRALVGGLLITAGAVAVVSLLFLWLISTRQPEVVVPDVTGASWADAMARLRALGLTMVVAEERYTLDAAPDTVIGVIAPYPGKRVRRGRQVRVVLSKGAGNVRVPDVRHLAMPEARKELEKAHLKVAETTEQRPDYGVPEGQVVAQRPESGAVVAPGTEVALVCSSGRPKPERVRPDTVSWYRVRVTVPAGEMTQRVRIEVEDRDGTVRVVHDRPHVRGHTAEELVRGVGAFTIRVYVDDELWREVRPVRE